ncbi:MAG TPA: ABC transporter permease [Vicinamibacterales bacterium]|nr:ABC transporter permease [Vicinamibacterales bacterium]
MDIPVVVVRSPVLPGLARYLNPVALVRHLWRHREFIGQLTRREIEGRYRSSLLGLTWSFINPIVLLLVYTFVFGVVFRQRWGVHADGLGEYGLVLFAGIIAFGVFSECVNRAPGLIVGTPNYVKRVVFPLELLPLGVMGSAVFHAAVSLSVLLVAAAVSGLPPRPSWLLVPLALAPVVLLSLGLLWMLSSLGVFLRDLGYGVTLAVQVLFFLTPIFYPLDAIPERFQIFVRLNPLTSVVVAVRAAIFPGLEPLWTDLAVSLGASSVLMLLGYAWFMRTRRAFGDVI